MEMKIQLICVIISVMMRCSYLLFVGFPVLLYLLIRGVDITKVSLILFSFSFFFFLSYKRCFFFVWLFFFFLFLFFIIYFFYFIYYYYFFFFSGIASETDDFEKRGVYVGLVGARFEKSNHMESTHIVVAKRNDEEAGYGKS